ncbi:hypothetical protein JCM19238_1695 [Vibrio ponticus]|nr:hypothetical protein JCM19238_1695 [Vibrio ponticus]
MCWNGSGALPRFTGWATGAEMPLIDQVEEFDLRFFDGKQWSNSWDKALSLRLLSK